MQLDALLRSLQLHSSGFFDRVAILYCTSDAKHKGSYLRLQREHPTIEFHREQFLGRFRRLLFSKCLLEGYPFTCMMVDDNILFRNISEHKQNILESINDNTFTFSLRLGLNCTYSHPANKHFKIRNYKEAGNGIITWPWREQEEGDFKYPLSTDGHIYKTHFLQKVLKQIQFINPNSMEAGMQQFLPSSGEHMMSFLQSRLVGVPANIVTSTTNNFFGKEYFYKPEDLCSKYLDGLRIDLSQMDFSGITSAHQELKLEFYHS